MRLLRAENVELRSQLAREAADQMNEAQQQVKKATGNLARAKHWYEHIRENLPKRESNKATK